MLFNYSVGKISDNLTTMSRGKRTKHRGRKVIKIFPDSSWLIASLSLKDSHHTHVEQSLGFLRPINPTFYVSTIVIMETINGLMKSGMTVVNSITKVRKFIDSLHCRTQKPLELERILKKYKVFAKARKIKKLTAMDFYIVTEGMLIGAKILTADKNMYRQTKKSYKDIYLISDKVKGMRSDLPRLTENITYNLKA